MESIPSQPGWQDISAEMIQKEIADGNVANALFLCQLRLDALHEVLKDTQHIIAERTQQQDTEAAGQYSVTKEDWEKENTLIQEEINTLESLKRDIEAMTDRDDI